MKAAIITIGDELLIGQTIDTNSAWIGAELSKSGFDVCRITSVHDRRDDIIYVLNEAAGKTDVVLADGSAKSAAMLATGLPPPISPNPVHFKGETRF